MNDRRFRYEQDRTRLAREFSADMQSLQHQLKNSKRQKVTDDEVSTPHHAGHALHQLRRLLPHGVIGRHINGYIFHGHKDAVEYQRSFRQYLYTQRLRPPFQLSEFEKEDNSDDHGHDVFESSLVGCRSGSPYMWIHVCRRCSAPTMISLIHEKCEWKNLQISEKNAVAWNKDRPFGFQIKIEDCGCAQTYMPTCIRLI